MSGFTDRQRERLTEELAVAGRELFGQYGLDRTRIADLTDAVGIGTSTFYQFFDSKETLYLEILRRERLRISEEIDEELATAPDLEGEIRTALEYLLEEVASNPLYEQLLVEDELRSLHSRLPQEVIEDHYDEEFTEYEPHARRWTSRESFRIDDPAVVIGLFRMVGVAAVNGELFVRAGHDIKALQAALIDVLVAGLLVP